MFPSRREIPVDQKSPLWTKSFLAKFAEEPAEFYVDFDYTGWLVWKSTMTVFDAKPSVMRTWDNIEADMRTSIGQLIDVNWFRTMCENMRQEPREGFADRFRMASPILLQFVFELVREGCTVLTFSDIRNEVIRIFGDGTDKNEHRATAEIFGALLNSSREASDVEKREIWDLVYPVVKSVFDDGLTPDNLSYWISFVHTVLVRGLLICLHSLVANSVV